MVSSHEVGVIGMATMGKGVARNLARKGFKIAIQSRNYEKALQFYESLSGTEKQNMTLYRDLEDFVMSLSRPRKIMMLVKAGASTDELIFKLLPLLSPGDILMDLGNSFYGDTDRRMAELESRGIHFMGIGISGGEKGALNGPSVMAGGPMDAWNAVSHFLDALSADHPESGKCCGYFGPGGAGHFVKMIHNSIEYAYMEILSEIYLLMREVYGLSAKEAGDAFANFSGDSDVSSYLVEITEKILRRQDDLTNNPLIEMISDRAGNKGTGRWAVESALASGVAAPTLAEAVFVRYLSAERNTHCVDKEKDKNAEKVNLLPFRTEELDSLRRVLEFSQYICFDQGVRLIRRVAQEKGWKINYSDILRIWENGCIIRTAFSWKMKEALEREADLPSFCDDPIIGRILSDNVESAIDISSKAMAFGVPVFCITSVINYYHGLRAELLPTVLVQAQRDFFGAHTYMRNDREGTFHTEWE
jgi:6-phosphogluconate dehydrogenase